MKQSAEDMLSRLTPIHARPSSRDVYAMNFVGLGSYTSPELE